MAQTINLRLASWPNWSNANPYQRLLHSALEGHGISCNFTSEINDNWLREVNPDIVHIHWPEALWRSRGRGAFGAVRGVAGLDRFLRLAGQLGVTRVWTVHNIEHHEGANWIDRLGYGRLAAHCDILISHSELGAQEVYRRWRPSGKIVVMPHGNYDGVYPTPRQKSDVLTELGLDPHRQTVCCIGQIRQYKGFDVMASASRLLKQHIQVIIAGNTTVDADIEGLRKIELEVPTFRFVNSFLSDQLFADIMSASDAVVLPYRKITGSGALLAAWTLGRGVVCSKLPFFEELARGEPAAAYLVAGDDPNLLAKGIIEYLSISKYDRSAAALRLSKRFAWDRCIQPIVNAILSHRKQLASVAHSELAL